MGAVEERKYKVELYIIPEINKYQLDASINEIDDLKLANITKLKKISECAKCITEHGASEDKIISVESDAHFSENQEARENLQNEINSTLLQDIPTDKTTKVILDDVSIMTSPDFYESREEKILSNLIQECVFKKTQMLRKKGPPEVKSDKKNQLCNVPCESIETKVHAQNRELPALLNVQKRIERCNGFYSKRPLRKFNSLISIDEQSEDSEDNFSNFCHHGNKNGCTASVPTPEEVSDKIFNENWLQKLESLRQKEALLKQKELDLQERERTLFKREKDLRILERCVKSKMKQADLYLKRYNTLQASLEDKMHTLNSECSNKFNKVVDTHLEESSLKFDRPTSLVDGNKDRTKSTENMDTKQKDITEDLCDNKLQETVIKPLKNEQQVCQQILDSTSNGNDKKIKDRSSSKNSLVPTTSTRSYFARRNTYSSLRARLRPKVSYDDLNSTLSADIGDASFILTSEKLDPELIKRPLAFRRSFHDFSNGKSSSTLCTSQSKVSTLSKGEQYNFASSEEKILKRLSDNIFVSQHEDTKFQNYGPIDQELFDVNKEQLRKGKVQSKEEDVARQRKIRPVSWNGEAEWLQKKRLAYNLSSRKASSEVSENKENMVHVTKCIKTDKNPKKRNSNKSKLLSIFR